MRFVRFVPGSILVIFILALGVMAQSGRKLPTWSDPKPTPTPTPEETKPKEKTPLVPLIVTQFVLPIGESYYTNVAIESCLARLKASQSVQITHEKEMSRKGAVERAKKETTAYVVLLQMDTDSAYGGMGGGNPYRLYMDYVVFTPGTAKVKTSGRIYQSEVRPGAGPLGGPSGADYLLALVGQAAADRILFALGLPIPR